MTVPSQGEESPAEALRRLAGCGASGEMIVASEEAEMHVYLLDGRIAWATSSTARNAFTRYLVERCGVAIETVRDVIQECQRTRRRFGETLVEWRVATIDDVRGALRAQIVATLADVEGAASARSLFLPRRVDYSHELTFTLAELVCDLADPEVPADEPRAESPILRDLLDAIPEAEYAVLAEDGTIAASADRAGPVEPPRSLVEVASAALEEGLDAVALRSAYGVLLGQAHAAARSSLWCALRPDAKLGVAAAVLGAVAGAQPAPAARNGGGPWSTSRQSGPLRALGPLETLMSTVDELAAVVVFRVGEADAAVVRRGDVDGAVLACAERLGRILLIPVGGCFGRKEDDEIVAYDRVSMRATNGPFAYYATVLTVRPPVCVTLVLPSAAPQGLGWAVLATVARQLGDCVEGAT